MSSILDVPLQLMMVLSLAASAAGGEPRSPGATALAEPRQERQIGVSKADGGPFRFSEQMWLRALSERRGEARFETYASRVFRTSAGRYYAPVPGERRELMALRGNPTIACHLAERFAGANAAWLGARLPRPASTGELYIAHLIGPELALLVIEALEARPEATLAELVPDAVEPLSAVAFEGNAAASVAVVYARLVAAVDPGDRRIAALERRHVRRPASRAASRNSLRRGKEDEPVTVSDAARPVRLGWRTTTRAAASSAE